MEIVHVSPVIVNNYKLTNTREATLAGLQYLFRNKIDYDTVFQKVISRNLMDTMINADEFPGIIFSCVKEFNVNTKPQVSL